ncbi:zinc-dependent alcohol dehydrogenase family protein [Canibacter sp. lx-45]|uniref:zinc-dependent alcohol dehydrogenase family protein n=1 Tax=Canibacter zhuwentaonis TaxID=2837491 RepID=UPI001BDCB26D|nr:zinc-dependent alcohol dehydrogenase family protein [Canibacter zhuwentaonis]MBT1035381.1 zinc-dependent alcohol dehydrogenase family protein [Canibacter zhuwentaonis]
MKAITYYGDHDIRFEEREKPKIIHPTDAIVKVTKTTICGTDLGIYKGKNPEIEETARKVEGEWNGRILGHEGIGVVEEVGDAVTGIKVGDKVLISCISRCGICDNCQERLYAHCRNGGGWIMGYMIDGTQAEYVRTPFADNSLYLLPEDLDEDVAVFLSDALPTGHEIGVLSGEVKPGKNVLIVGAGPVGMGVLLTAQLYSPGSIIVADMNENRLKMALEMGATHVINPAKDDLGELIAQVTGGRGVDVAIEAVGLPATWELAAAHVKEGGNIAVVGVHGKPVELELQKLWIKNLTITTGLVSAYSTGTLLKAVQNSDIPIGTLATHHFKWSEFEKAWDVFINADEHKSMKVVIEAE